MTYPVFKTKEELLSNDTLLLSTVKEIVEHIYKMQPQILAIKVPLVDDIYISWSKDQ